MLTIKDLLLQNHWANFNEIWHKASLGEEDSSLFEWRTIQLSKSRWWVFSSFNQHYDMIICVNWFELFFLGEQCGPWASFCQYVIFLYFFTVLSSFLSLCLISAVMYKSVGGLWISATAACLTGHVTILSPGDGTWLLSIPCPRGSMWPKLMWPMMSVQWAPRAMFYLCTVAEVSKDVRMAWFSYIYMSVRQSV